MLADLGPKQEIIVHNKIVENGGKIIYKLTELTPFDSDVTHIVIGSSTSSVTKEWLCKKLYCSSFDLLPTNLRFVNMNWINDSVKECVLKDLDAKYSIGIETEQQLTRSSEESPLKRQRASTSTNFSTSTISLSSSSSSSATASISVSTQLEYDPMTILIPAEDECSTIEHDVWIDRHNIIFKLNPLVNKNANVMAAFDVDGTIISTKSGKTFAVDSEDWQFFHSAVKPKLEELHRQGAYIAFISNQGGLGKGPAEKRSDKKNQLQRMIDAVMRELGIPIDYICATGETIYRKPSVGMWQFLAQKRCPNANLNLSFFVGDAAGRPAVGKMHKKDFSDSDYKLALNMGVSFFTPDAYFKGSTEPLHVNLPAPQGTKLSYFSVSCLSTEPMKLDSALASPEIVLVVAPAASGKTTLSRTFEALNYKRINQDTLKTREKCIKVAEEIIGGQRRSIVVDNTNLDVKTRKDWVALAARLGVPIRAVYLTTPVDTAKALARYRMLCPSTLASERREIPAWVIDAHFRDLQRPCLDEGFVSVEEVSFSPLSPDRSKDPKAHALFHSFIM